MLRSTVTGTVVVWLAVMSTASCTQEGSAGPADSHAVPSTPTPSASPTATDPAEAPQGGSIDPAETPQGGATEPSEDGQGGAADPRPDYMNDLEERLISVLSSVGVEDPGIDEHGFRDAWIAGDWRGRTALVHGSPDPIVLTSDEVVDNVELGGVPAQVVATTSFGKVVRFECSEVGYDVASLAGDGEPGSSDITSAVQLAQLLVPELYCDGPPDGMSELEQRLVSAMASVGVDGAGVWEHGFRDAHIAGDWRGRTAFVHGYEDPAAQTPGDVVDNVDLGSLSADVVATKTFGDVVRFPCGEVGYDVASLAGDGEPGSSHIPSAVELARLLVPELSC